MEYTFKGYIKSINTKKQNKSIVKFKFTSNISINKDSASIAISYVGQEKTMVSKVLDSNAEFVIKNNNIFTLLASNKNDEFIITYDASSNEILKVEINYD